MGDDETLRLKQPKTYEEQIQILKDCGLMINNEIFAKDILSKINYYRFSAYTLTLKKDNLFHEGATFEKIYDLYKFDQKLRILLLSLLEQIEISFRTKISYHLAHKYGATPHLDLSNFEDEHYFYDMTRQIDSEIKRSKELFILHHQEKYDSVFPIWVVIEVTSFSLLSKIYSNLKSEDQDSIASYYSNNRFYIKNWLYDLSTLRNICAHFGRLYNRHLPIHFKLSKSQRKKVKYGNTTFSAIFVIGKIINDPELYSSFIININALI